MTIIRGKNGHFLHIVENNVSEFETFDSLMQSILRAGSIPNAADKRLLDEFKATEVFYKNEDKLSTQLIDHTSLDESKVDRAEKKSEPSEIPLLKRLSMRSRSLAKTATSSGISLMKGRVRSFDYKRSPMEHGSIHPSASSTQKSFFEEGQMKESEKYDGEKEERQPIGIYRKSRSFVKKATLPGGFLSKKNVYESRFPPEEPQHSRSLGKIMKKNISQSRFPSEEPRKDGLLGKSPNFHGKFRIKKSRCRFSSSNYDPEEYLTEEQEKCSNKKEKIKMGKQYQKSRSLVKCAASPGRYLMKQKRTQASPTSKQMLTDEDLHYYTSSFRANEMEDLEKYIGKIDEHHMCEQEEYLKKKNYGSFC